MSACPDCVRCPECRAVLYCLSQETTDLPPCEHYGFCHTCRFDLCTRCINEIQEVPC